MWNLNAEEFASDLNITSSDLETAWGAVRWSWGNDAPCSNIKLCATHIDNITIIFGVIPIDLKHLVQRLTTSAHDCIVNAKKALMGINGDGQNPDHGLAVAWVMASQIHNKPMYDWLRTHGDAVLQALYRIR
jgi:hypothetical protein